MGQHRRWSGGARGEGVESVTSTTTILPTPRISDLSSLQAIVQPIGLDEVGQIQLSQVSNRYDENTLRGLDDAGDEPGIDEQVYYEIEFPGPDGLPAQKRRFVLSSAPYYADGKLQWIVALERARGDRERNGDPRI